MINPILGILLLLFVLFVALSERVAGKIGFIDWHAAIVVFGGVLGSLLVAVDARSLKRMFAAIPEMFVRGGKFDKAMLANEEGLERLRTRWRNAQRADVIQMADNAETEELRVSAECLLKRLRGVALQERFAELRKKAMLEISPCIEGWEIVSKLAPSFGMVGTVTGMVQLFRNMADNSGNLGGAMAMALLATLYGITLGAAVGGPMSSRLNNQLNERLAHIDLLEKSIAALVEEDMLRVGE